MRQSISFKNVKSLTKQSFKDECDINKILEKFEKTGAITHYSKHAPQYGDTSKPQLHEAMTIVADAESMFEELPSAVRKKFKNDPGQFLEFVQNPKNLEEMRELGLAKKAIPLATTDDSKPTEEAKKESKKPAETAETKPKTD